GGGGRRAHVVHRMGNFLQVVEKFSSDVFVGRIFLRQFERDGQHVEAIHAHPTSAIGLFEMAAGRERRRAIENSNIVETEKSALEDVHAVGIFPIDPPGEVKQKLVK